MKWGNRKKLEMKVNIVITKHNIMKDNRPLAPAKGREPHPEGARADLRVRPTAVARNRRRPGTVRANAVDVIGEMRILAATRGVILRGAMGLLMNRIRAKKGIPSARLPGSNLMKTKCQCGKAG